MEGRVKMSSVDDNKAIVRAFYESAFGGEPERAVERYVGNRYIQHNPQADDGTAPFIQFVRQMRRDYPDMRLEIKRVIGEGDLVVTHAHLVLKAGDRGMALADFFRVENGKVVEHWDVIQPIPETSANRNTMF